MIVTMETASEQHDDKTAVFIMVIVYCVRKDYFQRMSE